MVEWEHWKLTVKINSGVFNAWVLNFISLYSIHVDFLKLDI